MATQSSRMHDDGGNDIIVEALEAGVQCHGRGLLLQHRPSWTRQSGADGQALESASLSSWMCFLSFSSSLSVLHMDNLLGFVQFFVGLKLVNQHLKVAST